MKKSVQSKQELAKKWAEKGFSCDLWVDPPGQTWENYIHDVDEVVCAAEGELEFEVSGKKQILKPGDEIFIPAHARHSVRNIGGKTARWYYGYRR
ncbi:MAG: cupin domain-containing protein [Candidatus Omnitrophica bacterium]|nr:cupin domain-containing protein [Candidatus Omnitrophota bacterium]